MQTGANMQRPALIIFSSLLFASISVQAGSHGNNMQMKMAKGQPDNAIAMKHANPMPNLMKVAMKYGDELHLNAQQKAEMVKWSKKAGPIMNGLVTDVIKAEKDLHSAALSNASQADLQDMMDKVLSLRLQVAKGKMRCRENMRKVLDARQWDEVVSLYQQKIM